MRKRLLVSITLLFCIIAGGFTAYAEEDLIARIEQLEQKVAALEERVAALEGGDTSTGIPTSTLAEEDLVGSWEYVYVYTGGITSHKDHELHASLELAEYGYGNCLTYDPSFDEDDSNYVFTRSPITWSIKENGLVEIEIGDTKWGMKADLEKDPMELTRLDDPEMVYVKQS